MKRTCIYQNTHRETEAEAPSGPRKSTSLYPFTNCGHHSTQKIVSFQLRDLLRLSWKWGLLAPLYRCVEHGPKAGVSPIDLQLKEIIKAGGFVRALKVTGTEQAKKLMNSSQKSNPFLSSSCVLLGPLSSKGCQRLRPCF